MEQSFFAIFFIFFLSNDSAFADFVYTGSYTNNTSDTLHYLSIKYNSDQTINGVSNAGGGGSNVILEPEEYTITLEVNLPPGQSVNFTFDYTTPNNTGILKGDNGFSNPVPGTPIPSAMWLVGSALAGLIGFCRRKLPI